MINHNKVMTHEPSEYIAKAKRVVREKYGVECSGKVLAVELVEEEVSRWPQKYG